MGYDHNIGLVGPMCMQHTLLTFVTACMCRNAQAQCQSACGRKQSSATLILHLDCRGRMLILYNIAPDLQRMSSWVWRIRLLSWATGNRDVIQRLQRNE